MYYYMFVFTVVAFVILRGMRLARASGFDFYKRADFILAATLLTAFGVTVVPILHETADGQPGTLIPWVVMLFGFLISGAVSYRGQRQAMDRQPARWRKWVQVRQRMSLMDRLAGRYPSLDE